MVLTKKPRGERSPSGFPEPATSGESNPSEFLDRKLEPEQTGEGESESEDDDAER